MTDIVCNKKNKPNDRYYRPCITVYSQSLPNHIEYYN